MGLGKDGNKDADLQAGVLGEQGCCKWSLRHQVVFTVRRSSEVMLLSPETEWQKQQDVSHQSVLDGEA